MGWLGWLGWLRRLNGGPGGVLACCCHCMLHGALRCPGRCLVWLRCCLLSGLLPACLTCATVSLPAWSLSSITTCGQEQGATAGQATCGPTHTGCAALLGCDCGVRCELSAHQGQVHGAAVPFQVWPLRGTALDTGAVRHMASAHMAPSNSRPPAHRASRLHSSKSQHRQHIRQPRHSP